MPNTRTLINREKKTIQHMIGIYCHGQKHAVGKVCGKCRLLLHYAIRCINSCHYQAADKPVCGICPTQCFNPDMREQFNGIMRYAGPRMLLFHPILTTLHFCDALRNMRRMKMQKR